MADSEFFIGLVFDGDYSPEAAAWCNARGDCYIDVNADGKYEILAIPAATTEELMGRLRNERNKRLAATDYLVLPDYPMSDASAIRTYRQALRDLPAQVGAPWDGGGENTPWPMRSV